MSIIFSFLRDDFTTSIFDSSPSRFDANENKPSSSPRCSSLNTIHSLYKPNSDIFYQKREGEHRASTVENIEMYRINHSRRYLPNNKYEKHIYNGGKNWDDTPPFFTKIRNRTTFPITRLSPSSRTKFLASTLTTIQHYKPVSFNERIHKMLVKRRTKTVKFACRGSVYRRDIIVQLIEFRKC